MSLRQADRLAALADRLSDRDLEVIDVVSRLRFVSTGQLSRLLFIESERPATRVRRAQHATVRLSELGLLYALDRRVGGVRAGSSGFIWTPTGEAIRLAAYRAGAGIGKPRVSQAGGRFALHATLASELYVQLVEAERVGSVVLLDHQAEPSCWRDFYTVAGANTLRPDLYAKVVRGDEEISSFVEIDRATEGSASLRAKLARYVAYWRSGAEQQTNEVFPQVVWAVDRPGRARLLERLIAEQPPEHQRLFVVCRFAQATSVLAGGRS